MTDCPDWTIYFSTDYTDNLTICMGIGYKIETFITKDIKEGKITVLMVCYSNSITE